MKRVPIWPGGADRAGAGTWLAPSAAGAGLQGDRRSISAPPVVSGRSISRAARCGGNTATVGIAVTRSLFVQWPHPVCPRLWQSRVVRHRFCGWRPGLDVDVIGWPRRTAFSTDGRLAYFSAWESNRLSIADTTTNALAREVGPFSGYLCPFTTNRKGTVFANVDGLVGFEVGDLHTGLLLDRVQLDDYAPAQLAAYECPSHGIAFTSDDANCGWLTAWTIGCASSTRRSIRRSRYFRSRSPGNRGRLRSARMAGLPLCPLVMCST